MDEHLRRAITRPLIREGVRQHADDDCHVDNKRDRFCYLMANAHAFGKAAGKPIFRWPFVSGASKAIFTADGPLRDLLYNLDKNQELFGLAVAGAPAIIIQLQHLISALQTAHSSSWSVSTNKLTKYR